MTWQDALALLPTTLSAGLLGAAHLAFHGALRSARPARLPPSAPRVSVLKPLAGRDEGLLDNLRSFAALEYPSFELLLGVASLADPAVPVARAFLAEHPEIEARLVVTRPRSDQNPKVAQLVDLRREATGSVLVISDANVRVHPGYLRGLVAALSRPGVGLVSSLVLGAGERTLAAAVDSAQLGAYVAPFVVAPHRLDLWPITVGKSMAMRAADLDALGGFARVAGVLAEDDVLGKLFASAGHGVGLCLEPVENRAAHAGWSTVIARHARWAMLRRSLTPAGFAFELLLSPALVAAVVAVVVRSHVALSAVPVALALPCLAAVGAHRRLGSRHASALAALEPLRVAVMFLCWVLGAARRTVGWRGHTFTLARGSRLVPVAVGTTGARAATLARSALAGGASTIADLATLVAAMHLLRLPAAMASLPALTAGLLVQFFGHRHFVFRAGAGPLGRQALLFAGSELVAFGLNAALFGWVAARWPLDAATAVGARLVTTNLVYLAWSYPVWTKVFRAPRAAVA